VDDFELDVCVAEHEPVGGFFGDPAALFRTGVQACVGLVPPWGWFEPWFEGCEVNLHVGQGSKKRRSSQMAVIVLWRSARANESAAFVSSKCRARNGAESFIPSQ
jgi:hypothetical protein